MCRFSRHVIPPITPAQSAWLHLLRWVAAFLVCITHVRVPFLDDYSHVGHQPWLVILFYSVHGYGHLAVVIFFCLSGYLVGGEVVREYAMGTFQWRKYLVKRVARIFPVYLLALLLTLVLDSMGLRYFNQTGIYTGGITAPMLQTDFAARLTLGIGLGNAAFLQEILVPSFGSNVPLWSLSFEAWYYILFPFGLIGVIGGMKASRRAYLIGLVVLMMWFVGRQIMLYAVIWLMGLIPVLIPQLMPRRIWWPAVGGLLVLVAARFNLLGAFAGFASDAALGIFVVLFIGAVGNHEIGVPGPVWFHKLFSDFSYSLYLVHWPFALFLSVILNQWFGLHLRAAPTAGAIGIYGLVLVVVYAFALGFSRVTEFHTYGIRKWLGSIVAKMTGVKPSSVSP